MAKRAIGFLFMKMGRRAIPGFLGLLASAVLASSLQAQERSIAREWCDLLLESIRNDFARPPVHARNIHHVSAAMYDAWAV